MAILPVGGAATNFAAATSATLTYAPTLGNIVCAFFAPNSAVSALTVKDSGGVVLTSGPTATFGAAVDNASAWFYTASAGVTKFIASWTTSRASVFGVEEYSGVTGGVNGALAGSAATGTSAAPSITVTTQDNNDFVVAGLFSGANAITVTTGTQRQSATGAATIKLDIADNTAASAGAVTIAGTITTSIAWAALALELRLTAVVAAAANYNRLMMVGCGT